MASNVSLATGGGCTVTAQMDADFYASVFGEYPVVLQIGSKCEPTIANATTVHVADGVFLIQGRQVHIAEDDFTIPTGTAGTYYCGYEIYTEEGVDKVRQFVKTYIPTNSALLRDNAESAFGTLLVVKTSTTTITKAARIMSVVARASTECVTETKSLNDFTEAGRFYLFADMTDVPPGANDNGWLEVESYTVKSTGGHYAWQRYYPWTTGSIQPCYTRMYLDGSWGAWAGGKYAAGDNISISGNTISATSYTAGSGIQVSNHQIKARVAEIGMAASGKGKVPAQGILANVSVTVPTNAQFIAIRVDSPYVMATNGWISGGKAYCTLVNWGTAAQETNFTCIYWLPGY